VKAREVGSVLDRIEILVSRGRPNGLLLIGIFEWLRTAERLRVLLDDLSRLFSLPKFLQLILLGFYS